MFSRVSLISTLVVLVNSFMAFGQINLVPFVNNVTAVTDITHCNDDRVFIVEQAGRIKIADLQGNLNPDNYLNIVNKVTSGGERGLLGLAFSPNYQSDGRFYVNYTNLAGNSVISRFNVSAGNPNKADSLSEEILLTVTQPFSNHNGGGMFFGKDGYLYISLGDGGSGGDPGNRAQNLMEDLGKLLRINVNVPSGYSVPGSNPYFGSLVANPRIWASGLRNAWRVSTDRLTGDIWIADVGQGFWEEVNFQPASSPGGENYGWRCHEGTSVYNPAGCLGVSNYDFPVYEFDHTIACSVTGGYVYRGAQHANMFGNYYFTDYCDGMIKSLTPDGLGGFTFNTTAAFQPFQFTTFGEDKYGELYIGKNSTGVLKMTNSGCLPVAYLGSEDTLIHCGSEYTFSTPAGPGFLYQWFLNGAVITGADSSTYIATQSGNYYVQVVNTSFCTNYSDTISLDLIAVPDVSFTGLVSNICINGTPLTLTGSPVGGVFSGAGVTGNTFDPAAATIGTHLITYTYDHGNGCIVPSTETIVVDACLSTPELTGVTGFYLQPNPAGEFTEIMWPAELKGEKSFEVYDVSGKIYLKTEPVKNTSNFRLETNELAAGVYIVKMVNDNKSFYQKLIVQ